MPHRVLFVSKPIAAPFHDGSKCLVRDVARNLSRVEPMVMSSHGGLPLESAPGGQPVRSVRAYGTPGSFTPAFSANLRAAAWVLFASRADVWHFVFAPNPRTSGAGRWLSRLRRVPVVQTVASPPRSFSDPDKLFFGDVVVAQSAWTQQAIEASYQALERRPPRLVVIPPPVPELADPPSADALERVRHELALAPTQRYLLYPGDLETSSGAEVTAELARSLPADADLVTVFAYRRKSTRSREVAAELRARLPHAQTRFVEDAADILALVRGAEALLFPVDDLWGKVDLPIVLLEAMSLGVPVLALDRGPLRDLAGVVKVPSLDTPVWVSAILDVLREPGHRAAVVQSQLSSLAEHAAPRIARRYEDLYWDLLR